MYDGNYSYWMEEEEEEEQGQMYYYSSSPASVDCTLSLGTPSTRVYSTDEDKRQHRFIKHSRPPPMPRPMPVPMPKPDPLIARRCANCDTTSTPLWRNGPRGPKSLCNACGIRFKKEERRATAAASQPTPPCYSSPYQEFRFITFVD